MMFCGGGKERSAGVLVFCRGFFCFWPFFFVTKKLTQSFTIIPSTPSFSFSFHPALNCTRRLCLSRLLKMARPSFFFSQRTRGYSAVWCPIHTKKLCTLLSQHKGFYLLLSIKISDIRMCWLKKIVDYGIETALAAGIDRLIGFESGWNIFYYIWGGTGGCRGHAAYLPSAVITNFHAMLFLIFSLHFPAFPLAACRLASLFISHRRLRKFTFQ